MAFESLSHWHQVTLAEFPAEWLPLSFLYDPDLPLFPLLYFHALDPNLAAGQRPGAKDRVYGFVHHINLENSGAVVTVAINKDLTLAKNTHYLAVVEGLVRERLGLGSPITLPDLQGALGGSLSSSNPLLVELWHQIVVPAFGNKLPFGQVWDRFFGLIRFIASWNSNAGRKGELIQTHYFCAGFGERIATGDQINADFYLLPTFEEFQDQSNPLHLFPKVASLVAGANAFVTAYCSAKNVGNHSYSAFSRQLAGFAGNLATPVILQLISATGGPHQAALLACYNAFNRGPQRTVIALLMIDDLRHGRWLPQHLSPADCAEMYTALVGTYQSPKVVQLYAQQCFGNQAALPIDTWVETFLRWPLGFDYRATATRLAELFSCSAVWGRVERLIWVAVQARKVHSSVCAEILWCIRYGGPGKMMRGANPLACRICLPQIRNVCPAYAAVADRDVAFNATAFGNSFAISTSHQSSTHPNQTFVACTGPGIRDEYSPRDRSAAFRPYPQPGAPSPLTVRDFIKHY